MAVIDDFIGRPAHARREARTFGAEVFRTIGLSLSALAAGWGAAVDYERLSRRSDHQLRGMGLSRDRLPETIRRNHFDGIGGKTDG